MQRNYKQKIHGKYQTTKYQIRHNIFIQRFRCFKNFDQFLLF